MATRYDVTQQAAALELCFNSKRDRNTDILTAKCFSKPG